jgi:TfoX/Sxy family transcriptional regulator of competence genes
VAGAVDLIRAMDHEPKRLQQIMKAAAPPDLDLTFRPMFGGVLAYVDGKAFASLSNVGLALKLAGADHAEMSALPGARPLRYEPDAPPSKSYVCAPDTMLDDLEALRAWIARGADGLKNIVKKPRKATR